MTDRTGIAEVGWLNAVAARLWPSAAKDSFPRDLETIASFSLPITFVSLPDLSVQAIYNWISTTGAGGGTAVQVLCSRTEGDRRLRGCAIGLHGVGAIFTDPSDSTKERRFTAAHEIAHFLLDYLLPREQAIAFFGETIIPVLNGERAATKDQQFHSALSGVAIGTFVNLMERDAAGLITREGVWDAEARADQLALYLLAPVADVCEHLALPSPKETERVRFKQNAVAVLEDVFGLPAAIAGDYATWLFHRLVRPDSRGWLGL